MKKIITLFIFLGLFSVNAQIKPLIEYTWELEQVITADSTLVVPNDMTLILEVLYTWNDSFEIFFGSCQDLAALVAFDD